MLRILFFLSALMVTSAAKAQNTPMPVVASFSILADLVEQVGGPRLAVSSLIPRATDPHIFQPSPQDARRVQAARLIFVNGFGLEGSVERLITSTGQAGKRVVLGKTVKPLRLVENGKDQGLDPHTWHDVANVKLYVHTIRDALIAADPDGRADYTARSAAYLAALDTLEADIRQGLATLPPERRVIVTTHDAFGYFARAYAITLIAPQGVSTETEPSARDMARVIKQIRDQKIPAVFMENITDPRLMERISRETGAKIGDKLFTDSLSVENGPAPTYIDLMRANLASILKALRP
jgi:zinc/manganese transport system substrate-binding protein